jgi:hypothetical protein
MPVGIGKSLVVAIALLTANTAPGLAQSPPAAERTLVDVRVSGMDDAIRRLQRVASEPQAPGQRDAQNALLALTLLRGFARPGAAEAGRSRHDFQIEVTADARLIVNGVDISIIQQALRPR